MKLNQYLQTHLHRLQQIIFKYLGAKISLENSNILHPLQLS